MPIQIRFQESHYVPYLKNQAIFRVSRALDAEAGGQCALPGDWLEEENHHISLLYHRQSSPLEAVLSMLPFYQGLFPTIKLIDAHDQVEPKGFSLRLGFTITVLILVLLIGSIMAVSGVG